MLDIITHPFFADLRHGFFTRKGGVSTGVYAGLNCGRGSHDLPDKVEQNRDLVAAAMGVGPSMLASVHQTHSADVVVIRDPADVAQARHRQADAIVTDRTGIALSILTADCQPVLLADPEAGVIGAAHAGWKGASTGVLEAVVGAMQDLGAVNIRAVIGPCISQAAYEVGWDFMEDFIAEDPDFQRFFAGGAGGKPMFDLPSFGLSVLRDLGVQAEWTRHCTYGDPERFFSYRRTTHNQEADYGRLISAIAL